MTLDLSTLIISVLNDANYFTLSIIFGLLMLIFYYYKSNTSISILQPLPGPRGFPIVGYLPFLGPKPYLTIHKLTKKYGPILRVQLGSLPCLFLCSFEAVREALIKQSHIYSNRPKNMAMKVYENESDFNLRCNLDLFTQASFETTSATILWGLQYLIKRPEIQKKIKQEINDQLNGKEFDLSFIEAKNFPYLKAVIQEIHRLSTINPLGVFHCPNNRNSLLGYDVPEGITTIVCTYSVHYDPENFPNPEEFKPERFLTEDGQFVRSEKVIPFSIGKRFCPGEFVAEMEMFHILTAIIYEFELLLGSNNDNFGKGNGNTLVNFPLNFTISFRPWKK